MHARALTYSSLNPSSIPASACGTCVSRSARRPRITHERQHVRTPSKHYHYHLECITTIIKLHATRLEYAAVHRAVLGDALPLKIIQEVEYTNLRSADRKGGSCDTPLAPSSCPTARGRYKLINCRSKFIFDGGVLLLRPAGALPH